SVLSDVEPQIDAVAELVADLPGPVRAVRFDEAAAVEQPERRDVARIDVGGEFGRAKDAAAIDVSSKRFQCIAVPPMLRIDQEADFRQHPGSELADQGTIKCDDEIV